MLVEFAAFITALVMRVKINDTYKNNLWKIFQDAYRDNRSDVQHAIERLETQFECCGVNNSVDYRTLNISIPDACYKNPATEELHPIGCAKAITDWIWDELPAVGGVIGATLFLEIFGLIAAIALTVAIRHPPYGPVDEDL
jgi:hypothetical protein